jgi:hypothetical protein
MKLAVEISSLNGQVNIGGIAQPIISRRRIEAGVRNSRQKSIAVTITHGAANIQ